MDLSVHGGISYCLLVCLVFFTFFIFFFLQIQEQISGAVQCTIAVHNIRHSLWNCSQSEWGRWGYVYIPSNDMICTIWEQTGIMFSQVLGEWREGRVEELLMGAILNFLPFLHSSLPFCVFLLKITRFLIVLVQFGYFSYPFSFPS